MQLHMGTWASAIQSNQLDIEIRFGNGEWLGQRATLLERSPVIPVCHPGLQPSGETLEELRDSSLIEIIGVTDNWHQFFRQENLTPPAQTPVFSVDQSIAALELAANGMAHALVSEFFAAPYLQDGRLARALLLEKQTNQGIYVTCPNGPVSYGCQMFLDWIVERSSQMRQA